MKITTIFKEIIVLNSAVNVIYVFIGDVRVRNAVPQFMNPMILRMLQEAEDEWAKGPRLTSAIWN